MLAFLSVVAAGMWWIESLTVAEVGPTVAGDGDELLIRFGGPPAEGAVQGVDYLVCREGDSLASIAVELFGNEGKARSLALLNPLADPEGLLPGQIIYLR